MAFCVVASRYNFLEDSSTAEDCDGHGTHVASTAVGRTVGVAKGARVVGVRILDCKVGACHSMPGCWVAQSSLSHDCVT